MCTLRTIQLVTRRFVAFLAVGALAWTPPSARADLISHWDFEGHTEDIVGSNDGDFQGDVEPFYVEGFDGNDAIEFDGIDDLIVVQQNDGLPLYDHPEYSIAMWVKGGPQPDYRVWSEGSTTNNTPLFNIGTQNQGVTGQVDLFIRGGGGTPMPHTYSTGLAFDEEWHHIAWVDAGGDAVLYIDGFRDPTDFTYTKPDLALDTTTIGGILRDAPSHFFMGAIDDVRIYDHALTQEEVLELLPEIECPDEGDTHCDDLTIDGPDDGGPGVYVVSVLDAFDDSDDEILYTFTAEEGGGDIVEVGPQSANVANLVLTEGTWSITVRVDDELRCDDEAADAVCSGEVTVGAFEARMISHWPFDGDTADAVSENDGIFEGDIEPFFVEGFDGTEEGAIQFDGVDDLVVVEQNDSLPLYNLPTFSIAMWVKGGPQPDYRVWSEGSTLNRSPLFNIGTQNGGTSSQVDLFIRDAGGAQAHPHTLSTGNAFDDEWHHIAWVDANGEAALYIDGVRDATDFTYTKPVLELDTTTIGGILRDTPSHWFIGSIDDVRIYNYVLSGEEVLQLARPGCTDVVQVTREITPPATDPGQIVEVRLTATGVTQATTITDTFPDGLTVADAGGGAVQDNTVTFTFDADGEAVYTLLFPEDDCPFLSSEFTAEITPEGCGAVSGDTVVACIPPPCEADPDAPPAELVRAFMFGALNLECQSFNEPAVTYTVVLQDSPASVLYDENRGYGYEQLYFDLEYGDRGGYGIFGPFDDSPNDRGAYTDCPEDMYDSNIIGKNFLTPCDQFIVDPPDPDVPCDEGDFGDEPEGIIFRVDVPNGRYRFVAAVGDTCCPHAHRILAEDGGEGIPADIGDNFVVLVNNHDQSQQEIGEVNCPGCSVFARVGFDGKIPPPGDGIPPSPQFVNMDEEGFATEECPNSPILEVTEGYIRIHQLQGNSNDGPGRPGNPDPNGGGVVMLELWRIEDSGAELLPGDVNGDGGFNISDAVAHLNFLFGGVELPECYVVPGADPVELTDAGLAILDFNGDGAQNISDAVGALSSLFGGGAAHALGSDCVRLAGSCESNCQ